MPSNVRITDTGGNLVAEFSGSPPEAVEKAVSFWRSRLPGEVLTIEREQCGHQPPGRWSAIPAAQEVYERGLPWTLLERQDYTEPSDDWDAESPGDGRADDHQPESG
jgi:hypothetical protein